MTTIPLLLDARSYTSLAPQIEAELSTAGFIGIDIETDNHRRHAGLEQYNNKTRLVFDQRRQDLCGASLHIDGSPYSYYANFLHADVENRIPFHLFAKLLEKRNPTSTYIAHNAPFELTVLENTHGLILDPIICSLQMMVSAVSPDEYDIGDFVAAGLGGIGVLLPELFRLASTYDGNRQTLTTPQIELMNKITGKESEAKFSYNGYIRDICIGYALKKCVKSLFNYSMVTYDDVLGKRSGMRELSGEEIVGYGCDDAFWCVKVFHAALDKMMKVNPGLVQTFIDTENRMVPIYANVWKEGLSVNLKEIKNKRDEERANYAEALRTLRAGVRGLLPFPPTLNKALAERDAWYAKNSTGYRSAIERWALLDDSTDDLTEALRARGAVPNAWAEERKVKQPDGPNFSHYMPQRVLLYDLIGAKIVISDGKTSSDGEARGKIREEVTDPAALKIVSALTEMASIDTRMKLFLTPYEQLTDPETLRMYPVLTSKLASRRMAMSAPNGNQLSKRGEGTYVRGFYQGDYDDHIVVSLDWSGIELVEIGEFSQDPSFVEAFGQLPHKDLHAGAAASVLKVKFPDITLDLFKRLPVMSDEEACDLIHPGILLNIKGEQMAPGKAYSYWRTEIGKGANFNAYYSGALSTVGQRLGWTTEQMWAATELFWEKFQVAKQWRDDVITKCMTDGYVQLPDGHRRTRFEATYEWRRLWNAKMAHFDNQGVQAFWNEIANKIQRRAKNQAVNSLVQGTCSTIAKRSILRIEDRFKALGWSKRDVRFMLPNHDELIYSAHHSLVPQVVKEVHQIMCSHPDIFKVMKLDASPSIGLSFEPWHPVKAPYGQIELYEAPSLPGVRGTGRLDDAGIQDVVDYLMDGRQSWKLAS